MSLLLYLQNHWTVVVRRLAIIMVIISLVPSILFGAPAHALNEGLQCVPYARAISGIEIYGDAHTWWKQAAGRYERGDEPRVGSILSFKSHGASRLGHISAVRAIVDKRTILVSHANWSRINGTRGHIEDDVQVKDVSSKNDWSKVKVWYQPIGALGGTEYPINGFIYPKVQKSHPAIKASIAKLTGRPVSKVALRERPVISNGAIQKSSKPQPRFAQLSSRNDKKARKKEKKRLKELARRKKRAEEKQKRENQDRKAKLQRQRLATAKAKDFNLDKGFWDDLDRKSDNEGRTVSQKPASKNVQDPIGDLLETIGE